MNIKAKYLLEASLETLHFETMEWLEEVRFWLHEILILGDLVDRKIAHNNLEDQMHRDMELRMKSMINRLTQTTSHDLLGHEKYLSSLLSLKDIANDGVYREKQKRIAQDMIRLKLDIRNLKKEVLDFLERKEFGLRHEFLT